MRARGLARRLLPLLLLLGLPALGLAQPRPLDPALARYVKVVDSDGGVCAGLVVHPDRRLVVTAAHCVEAARDTSTTRKSAEVRVGVPAQWEAVADVVALSVTDDVAVLRVPDGPPLPPGPTPAPHLARGLSIYVVGTPMGWPHTIAWGRVSAPSRWVDLPGVPAGWRAQLDLLAAPGMSGGAVYDEATGEWVGIVVAGYRGIAITFMTPVTRIITLLEEVL